MRYNCPPESLNRVLQKLYSQEYGNPEKVIKFPEEDRKYIIEYVYDDEPARDPKDFPNLYKLYREFKAVSSGSRKPAGKIIQFSDYQKAVIHG